jgi:hypothetical protein
MNENEHGTAAVEAAFIFPLIILIVIALAEYGHYYLSAYRYQQAVFSGARVGAIAQSDKETVAEAETVRLLGEMGITAIPPITVESDIAGPIEGKTFIEVSIDTPFQPILSYSADLLPSRIAVKASQLNY